MYQERRGPDLPRDSVQPGTTIIRINDQRGANVLAENLVLENSGNKKASITHYGPGESDWRLNNLGLERAIFLREISDEVERAKMHGEKFASLHEGYAVLLEEVDELWDICRMKRKNRDRQNTRTELIQIAAILSLSDPAGDEAWRTGSQENSRRAACFARDVVLATSRCSDKSFVTNR